MKLRSGLTDWDALDEQAEILPRGEEVAQTTFLQPAHMSPAARLHWNELLDEEIEESIELRIQSELSKCRRLIHHDNDTGGFFVALFRHRPEATPEGIAKSFIRKRKSSLHSDWVPLVLDQPQTNRHTIYSANPETVDEAKTRYGIDGTGLSWWTRGKRLNIAPKMVEERIFNQKCPNKRGNLWPEGTFHPLKLIHVGLPAFTKKRDAWRSRQEAVPALQSLITGSKHSISTDTLTRLLKGWAPMMEDYNSEFEPIEVDGPLLLSSQLPSGEALISAWAGARLTLMLDEKGRDILRLKLGMPFQADDEEE